MKELQSASVKIDDNDERHFDLRKRAQHVFEGKYTSSSLKSFTSDYTSLKSFSTVITIYDTFQRHQELLNFRMFVKKVAIIIFND